jgi:hypothetical protein
VAKVAGKKVVQRIFKGDMQVRMVHFSLRKWRDICHLAGHELSPHCHHSL